MHREESGTPDSSRANSKHEIRVKHPEGINSKQFATTKNQKDMFRNWMI